MTAAGIVIAAVVAVGGWFVVNDLAARRERRNDRRDYRAKFLIDAWVTLEDAAQREDSSRLPALESAIAKIQLLGTARQNRVGTGLTPAPPTPPDVRVRIRRFAQH